MERPYEILAIGRCNADLVLSNATWKAEKESNNFVVINQRDKEFKVHVDELPSEGNDKVTSIQFLDDIVSKLDYSFMWGGGVVNSVKAFHQFQDRCKIRVLTISRPSFYLDGNRDLMDYFIDELRVSPEFLNLSKLNYNLIFGGKNKLIIRNKSLGDTRRLTESTLGTLNDMINPADGVIINALNHSILMESAVRRIHDENMRYVERISNNHRIVSNILNSEDYMTRPRHRKVVSVITPKMERDFLIETIYPYTTSIHNREDLVSIFYGGSEKDLPKGNYDLELRAMAQLRHGIPTKHGFNRKILDENNNTYVTLGSEGYLVNIGDDVYKVQLKDDVDSEFVSVIKQNKSSRSGAGDSFAAGITRQETLRQGRNIVKTAVVANTFVGYFLGFNRTIHESDIVYEKIANLKEYYTNDGLFKKN